MDRFLDVFCKKTDICFLIIFINENSYFKLYKRTEDIHSLFNSIYYILFLKIMNKNLKIGEFHI